MFTCSLCNTVMDVSGMWHVFHSQVIQAHWDARNWWLKKNLKISDYPRKVMCSKFHYKTIYRWFREHGQICWCAKQLQLLHGLILVFAYASSPSLTDHQFTARERLFPGFFTFGKLSSLLGIFWLSLHLNLFPVANKISGWPFLMWVVHLLISIISISCSCSLLEFLQLFSVSYFVSFSRSLLFLLNSIKLTLRHLWENKTLIWHLALGISGA